MSDIKAYKMASGDEIITRTENETDTTVDFVRPFAIIQVRAQQNEVQLALIPFCASSPETTIANIDKKLILGEITPINDELAKGYVQQTTGLVI